MYTKRAEKRERRRRRRRRRKRTAKRGVLKGPYKQREREKELKGILQYTRRGKVGKKRETDRESNFALT